MTKPNIHELARNGDINAIAHLLNLMLPNGITAKVFLERDCLYVALTSSKVAVRQKWARFIFREIIRLDIELVKKLEVYTQQGKNSKQIWRHQFKLEDNVKVYPPASSKLQSTNQQTENKNQSQNTMVSAIDFQATLRECNKVSQQAYHRAKSYASQTETLLKELNYTLTTNASKIVNDKHAIKHEYARVLNEILVEVKNLSQAGLDELLKSLDTKKEHLQYFTIALFGRTKAGKSTLCETLTCGNGDSIGKGSQRTTKDVREYRWQGLRLLDTPGIEAYLGEEDADKANEIIDQSDMILFLVSDESIQPGEFEAMARLQRHNKYFAVILNIKDNIERPERLKRFIARPEKVFDEQRLSEHQNHIRAYVNKNLEMGSVNIVCIHAMAAFLSTKPEYKEESNNLYKLSRVEELYSLIAADINKNAKKRRVSTFLNSSISFISDIKTDLLLYQQQLQTQISFLNEKRKQLEKIFKECQQDGESKIQRECQVLYNIIRQQIPDFIDNYAGKQEIHSEWERLLNHQQIENKMRDVIEEIFSDLRKKNQEFNQQFNYDVQGVEIDLGKINIHHIGQSQFGRVTQWAGLIVGTAGIFVSGIGIGLVIGGVGFATSLIGYLISEHEKREFQKKLDNLKDYLSRTVNDNEQRVINTCYTYLNNQFLKFSQRTITEVFEYIQQMDSITKTLKEYVLKIEVLKIDINTNLEKWNSIGDFNDYNKSQNSHQLNQSIKKQNSDMPYWLL